MTEDELHSEYGEAIVDIRRLGLYSLLIFKGFALNASKSVIQQTTKPLLKVIIDANKIMLKERPNGRYIISRR